MVAGDTVLVQRGGTHFKATYEGNNEWPTIRDDDLVLAWDGEKNRKITGKNYKPLFECAQIPFGFGVEVFTPISYQQDGLVTFTGMPSNTEYMDFYKKCYTARMMTELGGAAWNFCTRIYSATEMRILYNKSQSPLPMLTTIWVEFTNNEDPSDVRSFESNKFLLQP